MAKNSLDLDLIVAVHPRSGGQGVSGAWGRRRRRRSSAPRRMVAGATESGVPGLDSGRGLVQNDGRDTRGPLGPRARVGGGRSVELGGGGGAAVTGSPGSGVPAVPGQSSKH